MPVYEYQCCECGRRFEQYRRVTEPPLSRCPECRGRVRKVFRPVGIIFKGSGFHATDYRKPQEKGQEQREADTSAKTEAPEGSD